MLQFPAYMTQYPSSTTTIPSSFLLPSQWPQPHNEELLLAMEESDFEEKVLLLFYYYYIPLFLSPFFHLRLIKPHYCLTLFLLSNYTKI